MQVCNADSFVLILVGVQRCQDVEVAAILGLDEQGDMQLDVVHEAGQHVMSNQVRRCSRICYLLSDKIKVLSC